MQARSYCSNRMRSNFLLSRTTIVVHDNVGPDPSNRTWLVRDDGTASNKIDCEERFSRRKFVQDAADAAITVTNDVVTIYCCHHVTVGYWFLHPSQFGFVRIEAHAQAVPLVKLPVCRWIRIPPIRCWSPVWGAVGQCLLMRANVVNFRSVELDQCALH